MPAKCLKNNEGKIEKGLCDGEVGSKPPLCCISTSLPSKLEEIAGKLKC